MCVCRGRVVKSGGEDEVVGVYEDEEKGADRV